MAWEAPDVLSLRLEDPRGQPLPPWRAGAHIDLLFEGIGTAQYSLCGPRNADHWRIGVLHQPDGRGVSRHIHRHLRPGDRVMVDGPRNHFELAPATGYLFIAGGIGITPLLAMIDEAEVAGRHWRLAYGGRTSEGMAFRRELERHGSRVALYPQDESGLMPVRALLAEAAPGTAVYCCGPEGLLQAVQSANAALDGARAIHFERFSAPAVSDTAAAPRPFTVTLARSGITLSVGAGQSLADALDARGVFVPTSCREGVCGSCETRVLAGRVEHRDALLSEEEKARNDTMMVCVSRACDDRLTLDL